MQYSYGAYLVPRRGGGGRPPRSRRGVGALIVVLIVLTTAICLLIVFLPYMGRGEQSVGAQAFNGKTFYFLTTADADEYGAALESSQVAVARGGAGYIYNDGEKYRIVAAVYSRESDVRALSAVNPGSNWFEVKIPAVSLGKADTDALTYLIGEFFDTLYEAAAALDRGNITEAVADSMCFAACKKLAEHADAAENDRLASALNRASEFNVSATRSVLSYIRFVAVRAVAIVAAAL